jgi:integrase
MVRNGRASQSPVAFLKGLNVKLDRRHDRRALTIEELKKLFKAAQNGPAILGVSGYERKLIYMTAAGTGFRANELRTLTPECFDLAGTPPTITIEAGYSKHRRQDVQPIREDLAELLQGWVRGKPAGQPVFTIPDDPAEMIRRDMSAWLSPVEHHPARRWNWQDIQPPP